jgi:cobalt-zinc-cadmium resistance protein CzcA
MGSRYSVVIANVTGRDLVGFVEEAKARVGAEAVPLPHRLPHHLGRPVREPAARGGAARLVVPLSLGLIFLLLFSTFGSVRQACWC